MTTVDIVIVGAGPIGLEIAAGLTRAGADYVHIEAGSIGQTFDVHWPRHTRFLSKLEDIAIAGVPIPSIDQGRLDVEDYLAYLRSVVLQFGLTVRCHERLTAIGREDSDFVLTTEGVHGPRQLRTATLVLATGDMHCRRRLDVPGADLPHVRYGCHHLHELFGYNVLVVGGRNSAVEAAVRLYRLGCEVTLACRETQLPLDRISHKIGPLLTELLDLDRVTLLEGRIPERITPEAVTLAPTDEHWQPTAGERIEVPAERVLVEIGFQAETDLLAQAGVTFGENGAPVYDEDTMLAAPGVYLAGTASVAGEDGHTMYIETSHVHVRRILKSLGYGKAH